MPSDNERALRAENDELRERVRQLEQIVSGPIDDLLNLPLTPIKRRMLGILYRTKGIVTRERLEAAAHGIDSDVQAKGLDVHLCKLRQKCRPHGIIIETIHSVGFKLPDDSRAKLQALINQHAHAAATATKSINGAYQGERHAMDA